MKQLITITLTIIITKLCYSQANVLPATPQTQTIALTHATIHVGNGDVIEDGTIVFSNGKIIAAGKNVDVSNAKVID